MSPQCRGDFSVARAASSVGLSLPSTPTAHRCKVSDGLACTSDGGDSVCCLERRSILNLSCAWLVSTNAPIFRETRNRSHRLRGVPKENKHGLCRASWHLRLLGTCSGWRSTEEWVNADHTAFRSSACHRGCITVVTVRVPSPVPDTQHTLLVASHVRIPARRCSTQSQEPLEQRAHRASLELIVSVCVEFRPAAKQ